MPAPTDPGPAGVFAAALTPATPDRVPDASRCAAHCRRLLETLLAEDARLALFQRVEAAGPGPA